MTLDQPKSRPIPRTAQAVEATAGLAVQAPLELALPLYLAA